MSLLQDSYLKVLDVIQEQSYNSHVRELFTHLTHAGSLTSEHDPLHVTAGSYEQGAQAMFFVSRSAEIIGIVRYQAYGCPHFLAACEWLATWMEGRTSNDLSAWSWREVERVLEVPANKRARLLLLDDVIRQLQSQQPA
jgi:NifU-like protein involved in Fe-S cluster formation